MEQVEIAVLLAQNRGLGQLGGWQLFLRQLFGCLLQIGISLVSIHSSSEILFYLYLLYLFVGIYVAVVSFRAPVPLSCRHHC